jgi:Fanconi-associated nuclease 1
MDTSESNDPLVKREFVDADVPVKVEGEDSREIIDLTWDSEEVEDHRQVNGLCLSPSVYNAEAGPSHLPTLPADPVQAILESNPAEMNISFFCENESNMTLEDILWRLNKDQLLGLAKSIKCKLLSKFKV